jgi:hypothetical protein
MNTRKEYNQQWQKARNGEFYPDFTNLIGRKALQSRYFRGYTRSGMVNWFDLPKNRNTWDFRGFNGHTGVYTCMYRGWYIGVEGLNFDRQSGYEEVPNYGDRTQRSFAVHVGTLHRIELVEDRDYMGLFKLIKCSKRSLDRYLEAC